MLTFKGLMWADIPVSMALRSIISVFEKALSKSNFNKMANLVTMRNRKEEQISEGNGGWWRLLLGSWPMRCLWNFFFFNVFFLRERETRV